MFYIYKNEYKIIITLKVNHYLSIKFYKNYELGELKYRKVNLL